MKNAFTLDLTYDWYLGTGSLFRKIDRQLLNLRI